MRFQRTRRQPDTETDPVTLRLTGYERDVLRTALHDRLLLAYHAPTRQSEVDALDNILEQLRP